MTALMLASSKGHLDAVQALRSGGADLNQEHPVSVCMCPNIVPCMHELIARLCVCRGVVGLPSSLLPKQGTVTCLENCCVEER